MKKINLIEWLWKTDSHEKQKPQRFARYAVMLLLLLTCVTHAWGTNYVRFYCKMTYDWWKNDGAAIGAHYWKDGGSSTTWPGVRMNKMADDMWYIDIDTDTYDKVIFTRVNGSGDIGDWGAKTAELTLPNNQNLYTITQSTGAWNGATSSGTWSLYEPATLNIDGLLPGNWGNCQAMSKSSSTFTYTVNNKAAGSYEFCFKNSSCVADAILKPGNGVSLTGVNCTLETSGDSNNNFKVTTSTAGNVTITVNYSGQSISVTATAPAPAIAKTIYVYDALTWGTMNLYTYDGERNGVWPGTAATSLGSGWYRVDIFEGANNFILNNGNGTQTEDLTTSNYTTGRSYETYDDSGIKLREKTFTVSFNMKSHGSSVSSQSVYYNGVVSKPSDPSATGYDFGGWYKEDACTNAWNFSTDKVTADTELFAKWTEKTYSLTFSHNGHGTIKVGGSTVSSGSTASVNHITTKALVAEASSGYHFTGWTVSGTNNDKVTIADKTSTGTSTTIKATAAGATITAGFAADAASYTITYGVGTDYTSYGSVSEGHSYASGSSKASGTEISLTATPATHYKLEGWYTNAACTSAIAGAGTINPYEFTLGANTSVYAKFILKQCTITLNLNGGSEGAASVTATHGNTLPSFTAHTRTGYTLNGYYTESSGGTKIINADGSLVASTSYADASSNWNSDATTLNLHAQWTAKQTTVTLDQQRGSGGTGSVTATYDASMPAATMPTYTGYDFGGYYTQTGGGGTQYYTNTGASARNWDIEDPTKTLYAKWTLHNYTITYHLDGGSNHVSNPETYTIESSAITLQNPTKYGYDFDGWYTNEGKTIEGHTIAAGSHENKEFWAKWTAKANVTIKFKNTDNWSEVHAHAWDATGNLNGDWPGNTINQIDGWYTYSLKWGANIIFNNGSGAQSHNITSVGEDACYVWDNGDVGIDNNCDGVPDYDTRTIFVHVPNDWSDSYLNIYTWGADYYNSPSWPGSSHGKGGNKTEYIGGRWFKVTINNICGSFKLNNGDNHQTSNLVTNDYADGTCWNASGGSNLTTTSCPSIPSVTNASGASNIRDTQAQLNGTASSDPLTITEYGFYYSSSETTKEGLIANGTKVTGTGSASNFNYTATGLSNATTYYYIAYAVNGKGTGYADSPSSFTTKYQLNYAIGDVKGTSGSISSSPETSSGSYVANGTVITLTAPDEKTGYTWKGWYGAAAGTGDRLCATKAYVITMNGNKSVYACYTENEYNATVSAGTGGSVSPSGTVAIKQVSGTSIAAHPDAGYHFVDWTISGGGITPTTSSSATQNFKATSIGGSITANFAEDLHTVTVNSNNTAFGTVSPSSVSDIGITTASGDITATPVTGANFVNWTIPAGVSLAEGYANTDATIRIKATASGKTITANFTEPTYTANITTENSSKGTVTPASVTTGQITPVQITAEKKTGYMFAGWEIISGSGNVKYHVSDAPGSTESATGQNDPIAFITIDGNLTLQATWAVDRTSGWSLRGTWQNGAGWGDAADKDFIKDEGEETGTVSHVRWDLAPEMFTDGTMQMKMYEVAADKYYGHMTNFDDAGNLCTKDANNSNLQFYGDDSYQNFKVSIPVAGIYDFEWDSSTKRLTIHYPAGNFIRGGFNSWGWTAPLAPTGNANEYSCVISMTGDNAPHSFTGDNGFKVVLGGEHYGKNSTTITRAANSAGSLVQGGGSNINLTTDVRGDYTFTVNTNTNTVTITYPTAYTVTYGYGTGGSSVSASATSVAGTFSSGAYVAANDVVTFSQTPADGYTFKGWYTTADGNESAGVNGSNQLTINATKTVYAQYNPTTYTNVILDKTIGDENGAYSVTFGGTAITVTTAPTRTGYEPEGYYESYADGNWTNLIATSVGSLQNNTTYTDASGHWTSIASPTLYTKWQPKTYAIELNMNGSYVDDGSATATFDNNTLTGIIAPQRTGYSVEGYYQEVGCTNLIATPAGALQANKEGYTGASGIWKKDATATLYAKWTANNYNVALDANGGVGAGVTVSATYDLAMPGVDNTSTALVAPTRTGYDFDGYYDAASGGTQYYTNALASARTWDKDANTTLYAHWIARNYTVTLNQQSGVTGHSADGTIDATKTVTYDAVLPAISGTVPTAANGYAFMGFYTETLGAGVKLINADKTWVADVEGYTNAESRWVHDEGDLTLYAYYKKAEITGIVLSAPTVESSATMTATATVSPRPVDPTMLCWYLLYSNGTMHPSQPTFEPTGVANQVSFTVPEASGSYQVQAVLRTGSACGGGTELSSLTAGFQVAGLHNVRVSYKCGDKTIKASTTLEGIKPLEWSSEITPGDAPFGYTFHHWAAGDGITLSKDGVNAHAYDTANVATIHVKAIYDGELVAHYTKDNIIYFKNTLGWSEVWVNLLTNAWWNESRGSGNETLADDKRNKQMQLVPGTDDIYYYNYGSTGTTNYVSFTDRSQDNYESFSGSTSDRVRVVYPTRPTPAGASADTAAYGFNAGTPMFVPLATQTAQPWNNGGSGDVAEYYNKGYWRYYDPVLGEEGSTGYTLYVYNQTKKKDGDVDRKVLYTVPFNNSDVDGQLFKATVELEGSKGYGIKFIRDNDWGYTNITGRLNRTGDVVIMEKEPEESYQAVYILTTAADKYDFIITCSGKGQLCLQATFPVAEGDYRVIYTDNATWTPENGAHTARTWIHPSRAISAVPEAEDIISFFVAKDNSPQYKIEKVNNIDYGTGAVTWTPVQDWTDISVAKTGVYNFKITQNADGTGISSVENIGEYTGNYYIRTDNAGSTKWDNYRTDDHKMTYSEYAAGLRHKESTNDFTHYFMKFVDKDTDGGKYKNVKFTIANDYSPCISDTLKQQSGDTSADPAYTHVDGNGDLKANANIRFMWNQTDNSLKRAYLSPAKDDGTHFLVMQGEEGNLFDKNGDALRNASGQDEDGYNHKAPDNAIQFIDKENWMYEAEVQAVPGAYIKLYAKYDNGYFYFYGTNDATFDDDHAMKLITGSGSTAQKIRVVYDFKTDRLIAAWLPTDETLEEEYPINADIMIVREHQGPGQQINLTGDGSITEIKNVYGVMRFNRWTLNNKSTVNTGTEDNPVHEVLPVGDQKSQYERFNYFISFPFNVKVGEIFGFGQVGRHWRIFYYDGLGRAREGFFAERGTDNWRMIADTDDELEANVGYLLQLNYVRMKDDNTSTWPQKQMNEVELYFPAKDNITAIDGDDVTIPALGDEYHCKIDLSAAHGGNPEADRTVKDSYWRCIGVPGFTSYKAYDTWTNFQWNLNADDVPYLYQWQMDDNKLNVVTANNFTFLPMHAYLIQNGNSFTWNNVSKPVISSIVARRAMTKEEEQYYEFRLDMRHGEQELDHTFIRLTNREDATTEFDFGQDLSKELSASYNIYTHVGYERLAANNLPLTQQTTVVPVGVTVSEAGEVTFSMPEGTNGVSVMLIDNTTGAQTNLALFDYKVNLEAGDYDQRFMLEIAPIQHTPTDFENVQGDDVQGTKVRKVLIDNIMYIIRDGKVFDAQGKRLH